MALFYDDDQEYLDGIRRFIGPALAASEPVAAAVPPNRARLLRSRLNPAAHKVKILDMFKLGRNPARLIPEVERLLQRSNGARLHYIGEPMWPGRSDEEIRETTRHEALINLAWPGAPIRVLCPYDTSALSPGVLAGAERTHPYVIRGGRTARSDAYRGPTIPHWCDEPLPAPPPDASSITVRTDGLSEVRELVAEVGQRAGLGQVRIADLLLVASELGANAIRHGEGVGTLYVWSDDNEVTCQVEDRGQIADPLAGRRLPAPLPSGGLGLWTVNQLCDLVEARTGENGTTVRAHIALA